MSAKSSKAVEALKVPDNINNSKALHQTAALASWELDLQKDFTNNKIVKWSITGSAPKKLALINSNIFFEEEAYVMLVKHQNIYCIYMWFGNVAEKVKKFTHVRVKALATNLPGSIVMREYCGKETTNFRSLFNFTVLFKGKHESRCVNNCHFYIDGNIIKEGKDNKHISIFWGKNIICYKPYTDEHSKTTLSLFIKLLNTENRKVYICDDLEKFAKLETENVLSLEWHLYKVTDEEKLQLVFKGNQISSKLFGGGHIFIIKGFTDGKLTETVVFESKNADKALSTIYRDSCWEKLEGNVQYVVEGVPGQGLTSIAKCLF